MADFSSKIKGKLVLADVRLGIVCPMANERNSALAFVKDVLREIRDLGMYDVLFFAILDRVSTDGTLQLLQESATEIPELQVVFAPENRCVVDAYVRGYREALAANCEWVLEIDAGYSHQPADIPTLLKTMAKGFDCVFGSRFCKGGSITEGSLKRTLISKGGTLLANTLLGTTLNDMTSGFELFSRDALSEILAEGILSRGPFFQTEIRAYAHRFNITEVPIHYRSPSHEVGGAAIKDSLISLLRLFRRRLRGQLPKKRRYGYGSSRTLCI